MQVRNILIVGGGIGGLGAAAAFGQRGATVEIAEIRPDAEVYGVGINQPANSLRALDAIGVLEECMEVGYQYDRNTFYDWKGDLIVDVPSVLGDSRIPPNNALSRLDLHRILTAAAKRADVTTNFGVTVEDLGPVDGSQVQVSFSDGRKGNYDLVVAFDGIKSPMRRRLFGDSYEPVYTGYAVWRLTMNRPADVTSTMLFQGDGTKAGVIPLSQKSMYLLHVTPEPGNPYHDRSEFGGMLRDRLAGYEGLVGELREQIAGPDGIVYSPLSEVMLPSPWNRGRVIVLGDAAHACAPHLTQGAGMALEDAVVLAEMLDQPGDVLETLEAFMKRRHRRTQLVQDVSHGILFGEMAVTAEGIPGFADYMRANLPGQMLEVETYLNSPF